MKRIVVLLGCGLVCIGTVLYAAPRYVAARKTADRNAAYARMRADNSNPLVLDTATRAILANADRVETFRLQGGDEDEDVSERAALAKAYASPQYLEDHFVIGRGPIQGRICRGASCGAGAGNLGTGLRPVLYAGHWVPRLARQNPHRHLHLLYLPGR